MNEKYVHLHKTHYDDRELRILNALKCLKVVKQVLQFDSVVDFGCGIGSWLVAAKRLGATRVLGIEGDWVTTADILLGREELAVHDLKKAMVNFLRSYDLCISIEVAEHLPKESAEIFCDNLTSAANFLVFSAAIPGQGGVDHINEQTPRYWVDKFWQRGFVPLEIIRPAIVNEPMMYPWLKQNVIMFMNYDLVHSRSDLARFLMPRGHFYHRYWPM